MHFFTIYNRITGEVLRWGSAGHPEAGEAQLQAPVEAVLMQQVPRDHYIVDGVPVPMPERPSADHVFDWSTHTWGDPRTLADLRAGLKAEVARRRWELEVAGLTMPDGMRVGTSREERAALATTIKDMAEADLQEVDFKTLSGFRRLTRETLQAVANAIAMHVQMCFSAEAAHDALIDSITERSALLRYPVADFPAVPSALGRAV